MAVIAYSLSGEGRGHATRVAAVVEALREDHRLILYAPGDAYDLLAPRYAGGGVVVRRIDAPRFRYDRRGRLSLTGTATKAVAYAGRLHGLVARLERDLRADQVDLAITDFEPALPRAARRCGVPLLSVDHQSFLVVSDLSTLVPRLRLHARLLGAFVAAYHPPPVHRVVSSFFFPPLRRGLRNVTQVGVMLRPEVRSAEPAPGDHVLAYWRRCAPAGMLDALAACGREVRVYGLGAGPARGNLRFRPVDEREFVADLSRSVALVSTAGNQLVGEALFLGKPVLVVPEECNREQGLNAHFLGACGGGSSLPPGPVARDAVARFLERRADFRCTVPRERLDGLPATLAVIRRQLAPAALPARRAVCVPT